MAILIKSGLIKKSCKVLKFLQDCVFKDFEYLKKMRNLLPKSAYNSANIAWIEALVENLVVSQAFFSNQIF